MTATLCLWLVLQRRGGRPDRTARRRSVPRPCSAQTRLEEVVISDWGYFFLPEVERACCHDDPEVARRAAGAGSLLSRAADLLPGHSLAGHAAHRFSAAAGRAGSLPAAGPATRLGILSRLAGLSLCHRHLRARSAGAGTGRKRMVGILDEMAVREVEWRVRQYGRPAGSPP